MLDTAIIPAIIPQSLEHLREQIEKLQGIADEIQIDIVDGVFTPDIGSISSAVPTGMRYEIDLMIASPLAVLPTVLAQHPKSVVLHSESFASDAKIMYAIEMVHASGATVVLASLNDTPLERLLAFIPQIDGLQCMGIAEIGRQGNLFDARVLDRVRRIREANPALSISVDGSVNKDTIVSLKEAGANRFVVGSGIFNTDDSVHAYATLNALVRGSVDNLTSSTSPML